MRRRLREERHQLALAAARLEVLSPLQKLQGGYGYISDEDGRTIRSVRQTAVGQPIRVQLADGSLSAEVTEIRQEAFRKEAIYGDKE